MNIFCFFGFHKWEKTTKSISIDGTIKVYYKCTRCPKKRKYVWNPHALHACICGKPEGTCNCNSC